MSAHISPSSVFTLPQNSEVLLSVIVPVKDEAAGITETLDGLRNQLACSDEFLDGKVYEVLVLTNNCEDDSFDIVKNYQEMHPLFNLHLANIYLPPEIANIGTVRRLLMDAAYERFLERGKHNGVIASTDGDTEVDRYWVANILSAINKGNDAVGGRILPKNTPPSCRLYHLQNVSYKYYVSRLDARFNPTEHDPWPRHFQYFGASLAVTCEMYERAGRLPNVPYLEDEEFRKALYRVDAKVRMCPEVKVYTSARLRGKVEIGFSEQLERWSDMQTRGEQVFVNSVEFLAELFKAKYMIKSYFYNHRELEDFSNLNTICEHLNISVKWLEEEVEKHLYFGTFWEKIEEKMAERGDWNLTYPLIPIGEAIKNLRNYFNMNIEPKKAS